MRLRPENQCDFYKTGHYRMYPEKTEMIYSNFTCRSSRHFEALPDFDGKVVNFGLQGAIQCLTEMWDYDFFDVDKGEVLERYKRRMDTSLGPNMVSTDHIGALHDLGYLPILIKAIPEGERVDLRVPLFTIRNTKKEFGWLTNYLEIQLSALLWKPITTATTAYEYRRLLTRYAKLTGTPLDFVNWQGHDFSMRGMSGLEDAASSGAGHLLSFTGTDTIPAIDYLEDYYCDQEKPYPFIGGSVPATEHSVMCMGGADDELGTFKRLISDLYPSGIVSIVSDTWDFWEVITGFTVRLREDILRRDGKVVFRPDSGDPVKIICGDPDAGEGTPAHKGAVQCLWEVFGGSTTERGYKSLDSHVGLIYGDSITLDRANQILEGLEKKGFASGNIVFGVGSFTYQRVTRDTFGSAIKATAGTVDGSFREIFKSPKTDDGTKKSAKGLLRVEFENGHFVLYDQQTEEQEKGGWLEPVFKDGSLLRFQELGDIRNRLLGV